jgi:hypothetical protein
MQKTSNTASLMQPSQHQNALWRTFHKLIQARDSFRAHSHRYERRKVRECLLWGSDAEELETRFERIG